MESLDMHKAERRRWRPQKAKEGNRATGGAGHTTNLGRESSSSSSSSSSLPHGDCYYYYYHY